MQPLPTAIKAVVWHVIQRNAYWAHHESVLLALLADSDTCNRELAIKRITTIRQALQSSKQDVKLFRVPKVDQNMQNLKDLLPPMERSLTEPRLSRNYRQKNSTNLLKILLQSEHFATPKVWSAALKWLRKLLSKFMEKIPGMVTLGLKSNLVT